MNALELDWQFREGRDSDGDAFKHHVLVHASGRILAKILAPSFDEYAFEVRFMCALPVTLFGEGDDDFRFIDSDSAKRFVMEALALFDPLALHDPVAATLATPTAASTGK